MSLLTVSLALNVHLLIGIVLFSLSKNDAVRSRIVHERKVRMYWLFVLTAIVLWPFKPVIHYIVRERLMSSFP